MFFLEESQIPLVPENASPEFVSSGADVADFSVKATFDNPINGSFRDFSYGVKFREVDGIYQAISINSAGEVRYVEGTVGEDEELDTFEVIETFEYNNVATSGSGSNYLHLTVVEDEGWLFVNDDFFTQFTVRGAEVSSDLQFLTELENETQIAGSITHVTDLEVRSGILAESIQALTMIKEAGEITRTAPTDLAGTYAVEAEFVSGYERILGQWSIGFEFNEPTTDTTHWVIVNNSTRWKHFRQVGAGGQVEEIAGGVHNGILRARGDVNKLQVLSQNGIQQLFINGELVSNVSIQFEMEPVQISAISGFASTDQQEGFPTQMNNYAVWSFGI